MSLAYARSLSPDNFAGARRLLVAVMVAIKLNCSSLAQYCLRWE